MYIHCTSAQRFGSLQGSSAGVAEADCRICRLVFLVVPAVWVVADSPRQGLRCALPAHTYSTMKACEVKQDVGHVRHVKQCCRRAVAVLAGNLVAVLA